MSKHYVVAGNPGNASEVTLRYVAEVAGEPQTPTQALAAVLLKEGTRRAIVVVAMRFTMEQNATAWRKYDTPFGWGSPGHPDPRADPGGFDSFIAMCGLRPQYGFVRGHDAVLVLGSGLGDIGSLEETKVASLDLEATLRGRAGGTELCLPDELRMHRGLPAQQAAWSSASSSPTATGTSQGNPAPADHDDGNDLRSQGQPVTLGSWDSTIDPPGDMDWFHVDDQGEARLCVRADGHGQPLDVVAYDLGGQAPIASWSPESQHGTFSTAHGPIDLQVRALDQGAIVASYRISLSASDTC
ncbi:MAG TPA: hypothetical protein VM286_00855 [Candidatus Thermoplasmatota archaeon]|nr:hypothetical protein [Candidatus Thermoplasmatota archaeon]